MRRDDRPDEVRDEIRFYLERRAEEFEAQGMEAEEAWEAAVKAFGDPDSVRDRVLEERGRGRRASGREMVASLVRDLRVAARAFVRAPGFTLVAVATLALGIGGTTAIVSVAREALLQGPPVRDADGLVAVYTTSRRGFPRSASSYPDYLDYRDRTAGLADLAATHVLTASVGDDSGGARLVTAQAVTGNFFDLLGLTPAVGRLLAPADDIFGGGARVTVVSHRFWRERLGAVPDAVGSTLRLNGAAFEVVGVAPEGFDGLRLELRPQLWIPLQSQTWLEGDPAFGARFESRGSRNLDLLVGRLASGVPLERARAELLGVSDQLAQEDPDARGPRSITMDPLDGYILPAGREADLENFLALLVGTVVLALLLCCANLANLLVARASARRREVGVRLALGAGRSRLVRQMLTENLLLAAVGGIAAVAVAWGALRVLGGFELPGGVPVASLGAGMDAELGLLAGAVTLATGFLFGLAPALRGVRAGVEGALGGARGSSGDRGSTALRKGLVAVQVALCMVLLIGSGLFVRTLRAGFGTELGFDPDGIALTRYDLSLLGYGPDEAAAFAERLEARIGARVDVEAVATASRLPLAAGGAMGRFFEVQGYEPAPDEELRVDLVFATPGYMEVLDLPILQGRGIETLDAAGSGEVVVVSRSMAERYWPGGRAVGGIVRIGEADLRVVGVAENTTWNGLADDVTHYMYAPLAQSPGIAAAVPLTIAVRAHDPMGLLAPIRSALAELDPSVSTSLQSTMTDQVGEVLMPQRLGAVLLTAFGALALVLSAVGIAGVVAYAVSRQRREIGVRVALGASRARVLRSVAGTMAVPVAVGLVAGLAAARGLSGLVETFLFEVRPTDPWTYGVIVVAVAGVAALAALLPAGAATRVEPVQVLRAE